MFVESSYNELYIRNGGETIILKVYLDMDEDKMDSV
jgi:hypothetical protein